MLSLLTAEPANEESKSMSKLFNKWKVDIEHVTCLKALPIGEWGYGRWWYYTAWLHYIIPAEWDVCRDTAIHYLSISYHSSRLKTPVLKNASFPQPTVWLCGPPELSECDFCFRIVAQHVAKPAEHFGNSGRKELQVRRSQFSKSSAGRKNGHPLVAKWISRGNHTLYSHCCVIHAKNPVGPVPHHSVQGFLAWNPLHFITPKVTVNSEIRKHGIGSKSDPFRHIQVWL